jgi:TIR domain/Gram-negative bacterial TonB protein C-terminal
LSKKAPAFLSYARVDADFALRLAADLKAKGANVWMDQIDIRPGKQWDREVECALGACSEMLVILSTKGVDSSNVMDEVSFALEERKTVIPIIQSECRIPFRLRRLQRVDFRTDYAHGLKILLDTLIAENLVATVPDTGNEPLPLMEKTSTLEQSGLEQSGAATHQPEHPPGRVEPDKAEAAHRAEQDRILRAAAEDARQEQHRIELEKAEAARKAEQDRIEHEKAAAALLAEQAAHRAEQDRIEQERAKAARQAEQERLELEKAEAARRAEQDRIELEKAEAARQAARDRIQREKAEAARRAEQDRIEREKAAAALLAEQAAHPAEQDPWERDTASAAREPEKPPAPIQYATIIPDSVEAANTRNIPSPKKPFSVKNYLIPAGLAAVLILGLFGVGLWKSKQPSIVAQSVPPVTQPKPSTGAPAAAQSGPDDFDSVLPHENRPPNDATATTPSSESGQTPASGSGTDKPLPPAGEPVQKTKPGEVAKPAVKKTPEKPVAQPKGPLFVGGSVMDTYLIAKVKPVYPDVALAARVQGAVEFVATISTDGVVSRLRLVKGHPLLVKSAESAVIQWKYRPYVMNGRPTEVSTNVIVNFTLTPARQYSN